MKTSKKIISLIAGTGLLTASFLNAATTDPVGYVTANISSNSDLKVGVPLTQAPSFTGEVDSVSAGVVTVTGTLPDITTAAHFIWVTSGSLEGQWFQVSDASTSTITVSEDLETAGLLTSDNIQVLPFWTLGSLLPDGGGLPTTNDPGSIKSFVLLNDVSAIGTNLPSGGGGTYFPFDNGSVSGWLDASNPTAFVDDSVVIPPSSYLTLRNNSDVTASVTFVGNVPTSAISNQVVARADGAQDNQVYLPYPADALLGNLGLIESGAMGSTADPNNVSDFLLIYSNSSEGLNPATSATYFHFDNGSVSGWLDASNPTAFVDTTVTIPASSALIIRRAASSDSIVEWAPPLPYSL